VRKRETEVKLKVSDIAAMRERLQRLGLRLRERRSLEDNVLFDTPDRALRKVRSILRLRRYAGKWIVTFKGTPAADPLYKSRLELESVVDNPEAIRLLFEALGFRPVFRYQKYRSHYVPGGSAASRKASFEVALDETPIGNYLEIEGSRRSIDRTARQLGYQRSDYSIASYGALYLEDCRMRNIEPGDMIFPPKSRGSKRNQAKRPARA
jgi:adenylate cyclase class 2